MRPSQLGGWKKNTLIVWEVATREVLKKGLGVLPVWFRV